LDKFRTRMQARASAPPTQATEARSRNLHHDFSIAAREPAASAKLRILQGAIGLVELTLWQFLAQQLH